VLLGWDVPWAAISDIELAVSELVTNAVQATWRLNRTVPEPVTVRMSDEGGGVLVEVVDASTEKPDPFAPEYAIDGGRGLQIVAALSAEWGSYTRGPAGKVVWARMPAKQTVAS
jgi:anti-sigma regulatory factor (Ser/Thr protein kinase)